MLFDRKKIVISGSREVYVEYEGKVLARFKYLRAKTCAKDFVKFLVNNFEVEEYFELYNAGEAPARILEQKGYIQYNIRKMMTEEGYPATLEGKQQFLKDRV